ncbi:hypothetical protein GCM10023219_08380 [Stakelama sediminis]|uniref:Outer membrane beta-barrel porin/alpha-amylase n=1 Tax=Stakelama sediminis TaxID=463200 RepID=A0A840YVH8_9SPHN|nr:hypothetical protein [Stakelama sediminis]MBB5717560.1 hypothetical protein [Stakelama sediminis]
MRFLPILFAATLIPAVPALAQQRTTQSSADDAHLQVGTGVDYQSGYYQTGQKVELVSVVNTARLQKGRVILTASLPWLSLNAPGYVVASGGGAGGLFGLPVLSSPTSNTTTTERVHREGLGDLRLGAGYVLPVHAVDITAYGQVKLPTASVSKQLGTGKTDFAVGAQVSKRVGGVTPFANVSYTMPGKPDAYPLRDSLSVQAGLSTKLGKHVAGQISYAYAQGISPQLPDQQQVATRLDVGVGKHLQVGVYGSAGVTPTAPDVGAGLQLGWSVF